MSFVHSWDTFVLFTQYLVVVEKLQPLLQIPTLLLTRTRVQLSSRYTTEPLPFVIHTPVDTNLKTNPSRSPEPSLTQHGPYPHGPPLSPQVLALQVPTTNSAIAETFQQASAAP